MTEFTALDDDPERPPVPSYPVAYAAGKALHAAAMAHGVHDFGAMWAGQAVLLSRSMPAAQLVATLNDEISLSIRELVEMQIPHSANQNA
jgi:nitronate monooxygenase